MKKRNEKYKVITGHKVFHQIEAKTVTVLENADIPIVNRIYLPEFYKRIIRKNLVNTATIMGRKTFFNGLQTDRFYRKTVAGVVPENIVSLANLSKVPEATFDTLEIENNLNVKFINNFDLDYVINHRLLTNTSEIQVTNGIYFFNDLEIRDDLRTLVINNIELKNVVFDLASQTILASKRFLQNFNIFKNATIDYLNGINITDVYERALIHGQQKIINGSLTIVKPVKIIGNITAESINGYPIGHIKDVMSNVIGISERGVIHNIKEKVSNIIMGTLPDVRYMPSEFMYIERSDDLQVNVRNAIDARVAVIKDYVLIHVLSEESHEKCNLPKGCKCHAQRTVEITPEHSVSYIINKGQQRIHSYDDNTMTINFITNSISTNKRCRTNQTKVFNEISTLTWSNTGSAKENGTFNLYPAYFSGYISGVEFFTLNGKTYIIIGRFYDPVTDTHDLDCTIIRIDNDKAIATEIQKIPAQGVWTLHLIYTAQGVILIMGNIANNPFTEIYRFHEGTERFEFLRSVAYGSTKAVGVVLGTDSLIILANNDAPLQVLKYNPHFDNYYYYQMFALDELVVGISVFYVGGFGISDAYLCIVTDENYYIYSFQFIDGWKLESKGTIRGLRNLIPFKLNNQLYLFAPSTEESSLLSIVKQGAGET